MTNEDIYPLFNHMFKEHGIALLNTELFEIMDICEKIKSDSHKRKVTKKMADAERFVDEFTAKHSRPPTYRDVQKHFGLKGSSAAYMRLRHCRHKMKKYKKNV